MTYDVAVIGLGAMGSATAYALAARGAKVAGFDRLSPPHGMGSTHGHSRIIREAYYEHPLYVPLVRRAYELWSNLEQECGERLFRQTGGLWAGAENGEVVSGALASAREHGIAHELLDAGAIERRFPAFRARPEWVGVLEHRAGMLAPEKCIAACLKGASSRGAELHMNTVVTDWVPEGDHVTVRTADGHVVRADRVVVSAGAWLPALAAQHGLRIPLEIERQMSHWFSPSSPADKYGADKAPVALFEFPDGEMFLTMGDDGHGVKCGRHHSGAPTSPDAVDRVVSDAENAEARELLEAVMPGAGGTLRDARVCLYTNTPDRHFIIDWVERDRVLLLSPCSGHGFKFASSIGEVAAQLVSDGRTWIDLAPFSLGRFGK